MASTSETTFGNRLEHARTLNEALGKIAGYKPENNMLAVSSFSLFLDGVELGNNNVAGDGQTLSDARKVRRLAYFGDAKQGLPGLSTLAGRVRDCVGAMPGGKKSTSYPRIQKLTQKISNYHPPKKPVSTSPGETAAEKKKVSQSEASYGSLVQQGRDLAAAVAKVAGYNPNSPDLTPGALTGAMKSLSDQNKAVADALIDASTSIDKRSKLYDDPVSGLKALFQQAKAAVGSQFGRRGPEYASVSKIRY